jgi:hypothetical protein
MNSPGQERMENGFERSTCMETCRCRARGASRMDGAIAACICPQFASPTFERRVFNTGFGHHDALRFDRLASRWIIPSLAGHASKKLEATMLPTSFVKICSSQSAPSRLLYSTTYYSIASMRTGAGLRASCAVQSTSLASQMH